MAHLSGATRTGPEPTALWHHHRVGGRRGCSIWFPLGLVIALEPLPIIGFILVLSTERGARNGAAFIAAWIRAWPRSSSPRWCSPAGSAAPGHGARPLVALAYLVLGAFLLGVAARVRRRPADVPRPQPSWMKRVDGMKAAGAAHSASCCSRGHWSPRAPPPVSQADLSSTATVVALVLFAAAGHLGPADDGDLHGPSTRSGRAEARPRCTGWLNAIAIRGSSSSRPASGCGC